MRAFTLQKRNLQYEGRDKSPLIATGKLHITHLTLVKTSF